ncbi:hypothetical protein JCM19238_5533 [Vibrio ponticus]|nr:hypothetical protein JCM19238_5533 [Vibrio ponticus]
MQFKLDKKWLYSSSAFLITMLVTFFVAFYSYQMQVSYGKRMFESLAERQTEILKEFLDNDLDQIAPVPTSFIQSTQTNGRSFRRLLMKSLPLQTR